MTKFTIPSIGLGTMSQSGDIGLGAMLTALELGYRHIDTAQGYGNEETVGQAIAQSGLGREGVHVTTKIAYENMSAGDLRLSLEQSLVALGTGDVNLTLIHWPGPPGEKPMELYLEELARAQQDGLTRHIGVSNFSAALLDQAVAITGLGVIRNNQVEVHAYLQNQTVRKKCAELGIRVTGYMPVAGGAVLSDPLIGAIAERHGATPSQVAIAWLLQNDLIAIPFSRSRAHLAENLAAADLELTKKDMDEIAKLDRGQRIIDPKVVAPIWDAA